MQATLLGALLLQPPLLLIDHGHFQYGAIQSSGSRWPRPLTEGAVPVWDRYNGVMLGLAVAGCALILDGHRLLGSAAFCLCLAFKQMGLYYAPVFFAYLLGESLHRFRTWPSRYTTSPGVVLRTPARANLTPACLACSGLTPAWNVVVAGSATWASWARW